MTDGCGVLSAFYRFVLGQARSTGNGAPLLRVISRISACPQGECTHGLAYWGYTHANHQIIYDFGLLVVEDAIRARKTFCMPPSGYSEICG